MQTPEAFQLSLQQRQLWLSNHDDPASLMQAVVRLEGDLDRERLATAVQSVVDRHEVLRTTFRKLQGLKVPFQVVNATSVPAWRHVDWTGASAADHTSRLAALRLEERSQSVDFENGPTLRLCLAALGERSHRLVITLPAVCGDAMTLVNFVIQTGEEYGGETSVDRDAPLQYADFAAWQSELIDTDDRDDGAAKSAWGTDSVMVVHDLKLPFENPGHHTAAVPDWISCPLPAGQTPSLYLATWHALLWRLTGNPDISVLTVTHGRKVPETADAFGLFATAVPIQSHCEGHHLFADLLHEMDHKLRDAESWQEYFTSAERTAPAEAERPVGFEYLEIPGPIAAGGMTLQIQDIHGYVAPFKLKMTCIKHDESWTARFDYDPGVYRRADVERLARSYQTLLASAAAGDQLHLADLRYVSDRDWQLQFVAWNDTEVEYPADHTIDELFERQVARTPTRVALTSEGQQLTYMELNARANQLAAVLRHYGVGENTCVALCVDRSAAMVIGLLGILKAGGAYVPLSADHPKSRLAHQISEVQARVVVTEQRFLGDLPSGEARVLCMDAEAALLDAASAENVIRSTSREALAYVLYTSGSSGVPKGVAVTHRNLVNYTFAIINRLGLDRLQEREGAQFATVSTITADLGNTVIFPALLSGGCLQVIGYDVATEAGAFARHVARQPIDVLKIVPSHLKALLAVEPPSAILPRKFLILGGETLPWSLADQLLEGDSECRLFNHYGPTETTVGSLMFEVERGQPRRQDSKSVPIGRPLANTEVYVLDESMNPVPVGVPGELFIGGAGVSAGYIGRADLTHERFALHAFSRGVRKRLYRTGDVVRYLTDGNIEFLGRRDHQVKLRGFRVELGEVEAALRAHPTIDDAVVVAHEGKADDIKLVAYVVAEGGLPIGVDEVRSFVRETLPEYMVPSDVVSLQFLPLTRNGKVDRSALPAPNQQRARAERSFVAPRTPLEEAVAELWAQVLKVERVGIEDDFFELGGHSLLVTQVISRIRNRLDVDLPLRTIFEHPTVAGLALAIAERQARVPTEHVLNPLLDELELMSNDEAARLLKSELPHHP